VGRITLLISLSFISAGAYLVACGLMNLYPRGLNKVLEAAMRGLEIDDSAISKVTSPTFGPELSETPYYFSP
jgi:hypothetical protein